MTASKKEIARRIEEFQQRQVEHIAKYGRTTVGVFAVKETVDPLNHTDNQTTRQRQSRRGGIGKANSVRSRASIRTTQLVFRTSTGQAQPQNIYG